MTNQERKTIYKDMCWNDLNDAFVKACNNRDLESVKYLLTSPKLKNNADIRSDNDRGLIFACINGDFKMVKYLLTSPDLKEHANIRAERVFSCACASKNLELVKYLLTSPDLDTHADIRCGNHTAFINACYQGNLELVQYLLTSPDLKEHSDINAQNDLALREACTSPSINLELISYLIIEQNMKVSKRTLKEIKKSNCEGRIYALKLIEIRELNQKLTHELEDNKMTIKRAKL